MSIGKKNTINKPRLARVISGGQCGADLGGLLAAEYLGIATGGMAAAGYRTEKGKQPILGTRFGLQQHASWAYPPRTEHNVKHSCTTIIFASNAESSGTTMTVDFTVKHRKEFLLVDINAYDINAIVEFMRKTNPEIINIAGNRESVSPNITKKTRFLLCHALAKYLKND